MIANEQQVKLAAKLYKCRESAKKLFGTEYKERLTYYTHIISQRRVNQNVGALEAVLSICELPHVKENGMAVMMFMAAAVEIIEPSND